MTSEGSSSRTLQTTETSLEILDALLEMNGARVTEVADELDLLPGSVHGHLATLQEGGFVKTEGDEYEPSLKFLTVGEHLRKNKIEYRFAREKVNQLAQETSGRAHFIVEEDGEGIYLFTKTGEQAIKAYSAVGKRTNLHVAAAGKAILSTLPDSRVDDIVARRGLPRETDETITSLDELHDELEEIRERGYAFNCEEHIDGVRAVGAPVQYPDGRVIGALSVSSPKHRMDDEWFYDELPDVVMAASNELELEIKYPDRYDSE